MCAVRTITQTLSRETGEGESLDENDKRLSLAVTLAREAGEGGTSGVSRGRVRARDDVSRWSAVDPLDVDGAAGNGQSRFLDGFRQSRMAMTGFDRAPRLALQGFEHGAADGGGRIRDPHPGAFHGFELVVGAALAA